MADKDETKALMPIEQKQIDFYGDSITAALVSIDGKERIVVPIRPICDYLGLVWSSQLQRIKRNAVMGSALGVFIINTPRGGNQRANCLPIEYLPGWLFGIDAERVNPELRVKIIRYQAECFNILWEAFQNRVLAAVAPTNPILADINRQIANLTDVIGSLRQHFLDTMSETSDQVSHLSGRLDQAVHLLEELTNRQEDTETTVNLIDERTHQLTPAHRREVKDMVDTIVKQTKNRPVRLEHYMIYGRLKSRFHVATYSDIADEQFSQVMDYLREELRRATNGELPEQQSLF